MLVAARPILTSEGKGPVRGTLIFGRFLDAAQVKHLAETTHLSLSISLFDDPQVSADILAARSSLSEKNPVLVETLSDFSIAGYALLNDVFGSPALIVRLIEPRDTYQQGQASIRYFFAWLSLAGVVFALTTQWIFEKLILSRREYRESEERYRAVIEQAAEGIFLIDAESKRILEANAAFRELFGYTAEEIPRLTVYDLVVHDPANIDQLHQPILERWHFVGERTYRRSDGSFVDVESSASLISYGGREVICAVVRDITERKQAEAERGRLYTQEQTRREELDALYSLSRSLADSVDFGAVLEMIARNAVEKVHTTFARILLVEGDDLALRAAYPVRHLDLRASLTTTTDFDLRTITKNAILTFFNLLIN